MAAWGSDKLWQKCRNTDWSFIFSFKLSNKSSFEHYQLSSTPSDTCRGTSWIKNVVTIHVCPDCPAFTRPRLILGPLIQNSIILFQTTYVDRNTGFKLQLIICRPAYWKPAVPYGFHAVHTVSKGTLFVNVGIR